MKSFVTKLLVISLLAISLHGFGTDEKTVSPLNDIATIQIIDLPINDDQPPATLTAACDICVVVHQYLVSEPILTTAKPSTKVNLLSVVSLPPDQAPADILHPPIV
ncbi:MAG: hypothetical protein JKY46_00435 [Robiginitomaculum sp.]|nr:hypothetical protein [Robiginitomaculum sp.]